MKITSFLLCILVLSTLTSSGLSEACEYAGSNLGYIKVQTQKALDTEDHNISRFHAYKALNAIEKSKKQFKECGCAYAFDNIIESLEDLKKATRTSTLSGTKILLERSLENTMGSIEAIEKHELHNSKYASDVLAMNTASSETKKMSIGKYKGKRLYQKIDSSLVDFENSLSNLITTLDCKEAKAYTDKVFEHCEKQLLRPNLTEGKKYYNLKTKEIVSRARETLGDCK